MKIICATGYAFWLSGMVITNEKRWMPIATVSRKTLTHSISCLASRNTAQSIATRQMR